MYLVEGYGGGDGGGLGCGLGCGDVMVIMVMMRMTDHPYGMM